MAYYSPDYFTAKQRFVAASQRLGFEHHTLPIEADSPNSQPLTIDVAVAGSAKPASALVVTSGVHGVEGFFGSAVQLAFLESLGPNWRPPDGATLVFIHALNPFGFAWQRRFNEENVDLNRNFLLADEEYAGAPPLCEVFRRALTWTPRGARLGSSLRMALLALRHGIRSFWETLPVGQYEFPDWLYFGGHGRSQTAHVLDRFLPTVLDTCEEVVHLDFHTGLGRWANCELLLPEWDPAENVAWWQSLYGASNVVGSAGLDRAYEVRGGFGSWLRGLFPACRYRFATAEFGTYSPMRVIQALAEELHWHRKLGTASPDHWARRRLTEVFTPGSRSWRAKTLGTGVSLIHRATDALWHPADLPRPALATC